MTMQTPPLSGSGPPSKAIDITVWVLAIIALATLVRLLVAALLPAAVDEAYSIGVARQFSLSYLDHPPLHLWLVGSWARLWGSEDLLLLRLPFVVLAAITSWLLFVLTRQLFGAAAGVWAAALFNLAPVFGLAHGMLVVPDGPLLACSVGAALVVARVVLAPGAGGPRLGAWALAGLLAGFAMLSKYHGILLVLGLFGFLLSTSSGRRWLVTPGPWLAAALAILLFTPVLVWNAGHDWASFAFQSGRGAPRGGDLRLFAPLESLGLQSIYLLPWIAVPLAIALVRAIAGGPANAPRWLFACLATLPILLFTGLTLFGRGLPHWQMPGWLFAIPLLAEALAAAGPRLRRIARWSAAVTAALLVVVAGYATLQTRWGTFTAPTVALFGSDPTTMLMSWDGLRPELAARGLPADERSFIATFHWISAAELNRLFGRQLPVVCLCGDARHFAYFNAPADFAGWTGIMIDAPERVGDPRREAMFDSLTPPEDVSLRKDGAVAVRLALRVGTGFKP